MSEQAKVTVRIGRDITQYADVVISVDADEEGVVTAEDLREASTAAALVQTTFPTEGSSEGLRVVSVRDEDGRLLSLSHSIEPWHGMAGNALSGFFNHNWPIDLLTEQAEQSGLIPPVKLVIKTGCLELPGVDPLRAVFEVREGASESEINIAFALALAKQGATSFTDHPEAVESVG